MKATLPIQMCDHEDGCDDYIIDQYKMGATNWRECVPAGWLFDPQTDVAMCPEHRPAEPPPPAWRDTRGDIWFESTDGDMHTVNAHIRFSRADVERKWGPLVPVEVGA